MALPSATPHADVHNDVLAYVNEHGSSGDVAQLVNSHVESRFPLMSHRDKNVLATNVLHDVMGYGFLEHFLADERANEIMINSSTCAFIDRDGEMASVFIDTTNEELVRLAQKIATSVGARCDVSSPILDAWLTDGSRVHVVLPPIAADGPYITIRKFISSSYELKQFCSNDIQEKQVSDLIDDSRNVIVAGGTSSGKTTLLNCMMHRVDVDQRIVTIEETAELSSRHPHCLRLVARTANSEGAGAITMGDLVKASLRMRPDRIVVGEVRSAEAFDLIQALNTGHDGSLCTIHANGPQEVVHRLASLAMFAHPGLDYRAIVTQIAHGLDVIIYVRKTPSGRVIDSLSQVTYEDGDVCVREMQVTC